MPQDGKWSRWRPSCYRQLRLGVDIRRILTIVDLQGPRARTGPNISPFDALPDELFVAILEPLRLLGVRYHSECGCPWEYENRDTLKALALVSRRFNRLATPVLYDHMRIMLPLDARTRALLRIDPARRQHCRTAVVEFPFTHRPPISEASWIIAMEFLFGCTAIRCIVISSSPKETRAWQFISSVLRCLPSVQHLCLSKALIPEVMSYVDCPSLRYLSLEHGEEDSELTLAGKPGSSPLTSIRVWHSRESAEATEQLIRWPEKLRTFEYEGSLCGYSHYMDLTLFGCWLSVHKDTLESLHMGYLHSEGSAGKLPDLSGFSALKRLSLSRYSFLEPLDPADAETAASLLIAPNLEEFTWTFKTYEASSESWDGFGPNEEAWLGRFARAAAAVTAMRSRRLPPALRTINVDFRPEYWGSQEEMGYPWDRLDRVREVCRQVGLELHYSPTLSKAVWLEYLNEGGYMSWIDTWEVPLGFNPFTEGKDIRMYFAPVRTAEAG